MVEVSRSTTKKEGGERKGYIWNKVLNGACCMRNTEDFSTDENVEGELKLNDLLEDILDDQKKHNDNTTQKSVRYRKNSIDKYRTDDILISMVKREDKSKSNIFTRRNAITTTLLGTTLMAQINNLVLIELLESTLLL